MLIVFPDELEVLRSMQPLDRDVFNYLAERMDYETGVIGRSRKVSYGGIAFDLSEHDKERRRPELLQKLNKKEIENSINRMVKKGLISKLSKKGSNENLTLIRVFFVDLMGKGNCVQKPDGTQMGHQMGQLKKVLCILNKALGTKEQASWDTKNRPDGITSNIQHTTYKEETFALNLKWKPTQETFEQMIRFVGLQVDKIDPVWMMDFISYWSQDQNQSRKYTQHDWTIKLAKEMITYLRHPTMFDQRHGLISKQGNGQSHKHSRMPEWANPPKDDEALCTWMRKHGYGDGPAGIPYHKTRQWLRNQIETRLKREGMA